MVRTVTGQDLYELTDSMIDISGTTELTDVHLTQSGVGTNTDATTAETDNDNRSRR